MDFLRNKKRIILYTIIVIVLVSGLFRSTQLSFVKNFDQYAFVSPQVESEINSFNQSFGTFDTISIIILENDLEWNSVAEFEKLKQITNHLSDNFPAIEFSSATNIRIPNKNGLFIQNELLLERFSNQPTKSLALFPDVFSKFISENKNFALIYCHCNEINNTIKTSHVDFTASNNHLTSYYFDQKSLFQEINNSSKSNLIVTSFFTLLLIFSVFYFIVRSIRTIALFLLMIVFNIALIVLVIYHSGIEITPQLSTLPGLIAVLSFSDMLHMLFHFMKLKAVSKADTAKIVRKKLNLPLFLTSASNAIGFVFFIFVSNEEMLQEISWITLVAIFIALFSSKYIFIGLLRFEKNYFDLTKSVQLQLIYDSVFNRIIPYKKLILVLSLIICCVLTISSIRLLPSLMSSTNDMTLNDDKKQNSQTILTEHFFGNQSVAVEINLENNLIDSLTLSKILLIEDFIQKEFNSKYIDSYLNVIRRYNRFRLSGHADAYKIPVETDILNKKEFAVLREKMGWNEVVSTDQKKIKVAFGYFETKLHTRLAHYNRLADFIKSLELNGMNARINSLNYFQDKASFKFVRMVGIGFLLTFLVSAFIITLLRKSLLIGLFFLIVNIIPLLVALVLMYLFNVPLNSITIFLLSILVGLCLDDSIYTVTTKNKQEWRENIFPIVATSIVLAVGMLGFSFSNYSWLSPFGYIFLISFLVSLLADIFILPLTFKKTEV